MQRHSSEMRRAGRDSLYARPPQAGQTSAMLVGHINLAPSIFDHGEHLVYLVEALHQAGVRQHAVVRNATLAKRIASVEGVEVGPLVRSPLMAFCLLPRVDVLHVHEPSAGQAGLLSALTRSIPYVLTHRGLVPQGNATLLHAIYTRASVVICQDDSEVAMLRHWLPGISADIIPDIGRQASASHLLSVYQNSQRTPIAGNNGVQ